MSKTMKVMAVAVVLVPMLYVTSCSTISHVHDRDFAHVKEGDMEPQVIATMGDPSDREWAGGDVFFNTGFPIAPRRACSGSGISIDSASWARLG